MNKPGKKVFIGLSGGVDSSVSAALLKQAGYDVTGVFIKVWQPDWIECTWKEDRYDAMRVAAKLDIPFVTLDLEDEYKKGVIDYMLDEYRAGRTPNPDVMCNKEVKFGAFYNWAMKQGADFIATGHYAQVSPATNKPGKHMLLSQLPERAEANEEEPRRQQATTAFGKEACALLSKAVDANKDQTYFLWTIRKEQLAHILFPIGHLTKPEVRKLAEKFGLATAEKKDSQGLCFIGKIDFKDFLKHYVELKEGNVLDTQGKVIGTHPGALLFTIGERHGFSIHQKSPNEAPLYVISKDSHVNTITVSPKKADESLPSAVTRVELERVNWLVTDVGSLTSKTLTARSRYRQELQSIKISSIKSDFATIEFEKPQDTITPGQSIVMYDGEVCVGGGVIK